MEAWGDTPLSRCQFYRRECGLPAVIDPPELGRIVMRAGSVWAMTMPARLGQAVKAHMQSRGVALGPVVGHPRSGRWTFLIQPDLPDDVRLFAELFRLDVAVARAGATIALPSPTASVGAIRRWIVPPRSGFRPSGAVVVEAVRAWADQMPRTRRGSGMAPHAG
ncbi:MULTISPECIES: DNA-directed RNA polymerase subunit beta [Nocardia]|uniref:DNA-directed RNA polymerase subunit beta n=1 Tax=Nocardia TaxID=1817 RepID=UPI00135747F3|nr:MULTISPECIES: DNA-directed RNA polymerase subunit beta [Nocardia]